LKNRFQKGIYRAINRFLYWLPAVLYMSLIYYLSSAPPPEAARMAPQLMDIKFTHIIEYFVLASLIYYAIANTAEIPFKWKAAYTVMLTYIYGLTDELHQAFVQGRGSSLIDPFTNLAAACLAVAVVYYFKRRAEKNKG